MSDTDHWRKLEHLYVHAPTNAYYRPVIRIGPSVCEIEIAVRPDFHHAAHAVHGSVYFKMLESAMRLQFDSAKTLAVIRAWSDKRQTEAKKKKPAFDAITETVEVGPTPPPEMNGSLAEAKTE